MRRAFIVAAAALTLAGCGSLPSMDFMKSTPPQMTLQLESLPPGAEAKTSLGPSCRTPCAVSVPATPSFTVTYTLDRYQPQTVPVQLVEPQFNQQDAGENVTPPEPRFEPSPVYVELQPAAPPARKKGPSKAAPKRAPAPAAAAAPAQQQSPPAQAAPQSPVQSRFPPPAQSGFPPPAR